MADLDIRPATWRGWRAAAEATRARSVASLVAVWWHRAALLAVLACAAALNCVALDREGYANTYYAAGVKSMLTSWRNFYFASFDAGGFVTIDKPPLGLWVQAISAEIFGFNGLSLLLPQALAGVLAVALLYRLIARTFGAVAGLVAALALALTPIAVVTNRNNTSSSYSRSGPPCAPPRPGDCARSSSAPR
jgi:4-amino-4-deoxy-L-arabinose transferase-like glycosyltransferase